MPDRKLSYLCSEPEHTAAVHKPDGSTAIRLIDRLEKERTLSREQWVELFSRHDEEADKYLAKKARAAREAVYGKDIYVRALIEFTNYCKNDCYYCGIRRSNKKAHRYRLSEEEILSCCATSYAAGYRTFVLQGGEDPAFTDKRIIALVRSIKGAYPDAAITLSIGEKEADSLAAYFRAGTDRYLLRHESASEAHYALLHPPELSLLHRKNCLYALKEIGYQVGAGLMVGSPYQRAEDLAEDMLFLKELRPDMAGIGPFLPHPDTPFHDKEAGSLRQTLFVIGLVRLMLPDLLIPATTALGVLATDGRLRGIEFGANVVMQNVTPQKQRVSYTLYENKERAKDADISLESPFFGELEANGYRIRTLRGDRLIQTG